MAKILFALLLAFLAQALLSPKASAQNNCATYDTYCILCGDPFLPGMYNCEPEAPFISVCELPAWWCAPGDAAPETCPTCNSNPPGSPPNTPAASHPINLANGDTFIVQTDARIPGLGGGLSLVRTWNSMWPSADSAYQTGIFGPNWRSTYEERLFVGSDHYMKYLRSDGSIWSFGYGERLGYPHYSSSNDLTPAAPMNSGGSNVGPKGPMPRVIHYSPSDFVLYFSDGETRLFDLGSGKLVGIVDKNGNATGISYDSSGRLSAVADPASRHLYFHYTGASGLVTSVTSDFGVSLSYSYDTAGRLTQVTEPDSSTISFDYNTLSQITSVLDSDGHVLETHTYDSSGRGLTASQAGGVNAVTISY